MRVRQDRKKGKKSVPYNENSAKLPGQKHCPGHGTTCSRPRTLPGTFEMAGLFRDITEWNPRNMVISHDDSVMPCLAGGIYLSIQGLLLLEMTLQVFTKDLYSCHCTKVESDL